VNFVKERGRINKRKPKQSAKKDVKIPEQNIVLNELVKVVQIFSSSNNSAAIAVAFASTVKLEEIRLKQQRKQ
jgi:hypothetical protein